MNEEKNRIRKQGRAFDVEQPEPEPGENCPAGCESIATEIAMVKASLRDERCEHCGSTCCLRITEGKEVEDTTKYHKLARCSIQRTGGVYTKAARLFYELSKESKAVGSESATEPGSDQALSLIHI